MFSQMTPQNYQDTIALVSKEIIDSKCEIVFIQGQMAVVHNVVNNIKPYVEKILFSYTVRDSIEATDENGVIRKQSVFRHEQFMEY